MWHGIPNFSEVDPGVYRGGQPTAEGVRYLVDRLHVRTFVKLNSYAEGDSDNIAAALGARVYCLPINLTQQTIGEPSQLNIIRAEAMMCVGPVFVHCQHGQDRTGLVVALWRRDFDHWSKARAEKEMMAHGFHPWERGLYWYWEEKVR